METIDTLAVAEHARELLDGLHHAAPRPLLLAGGTAQQRDAAARRLCELIGHEPILLGERMAAILSELDHKPRTQDVLDALDFISIAAGSQSVLMRIEGLFSPAVPLNAVDALARMSRRKPICVVWPGRVDSNRLRYAQHGHPECMDEDASRVVILDVTKERRGLK